MFLHYAQISLNHPADRELTVSTYSVCLSQGLSPPSVTQQIQNTRSKLISITGRNEHLACAWTQGISYAGNIGRDNGFSGHHAFENAVWHSFFAGAEYGKI